MRLLVTVAVLLLALPRPASALSCAAYYVRLMSPGPGKKAPPNCKPIVEVGNVSAGDPMKGIKVWLAASGGKKVAASLRVVGQAQVRAVQLLPARPLTSGRYEIRWSRGEHSATAGAFEVTADPGPHGSMSPPILIGSLFDGDVKDGWHPNPRRVRHLKLTSVQKNPVRAVLAVWIDRTGLDYTRPPLLITDQLSPILLGQSPGLCPFNNYVVPDDRGQLRVGLKAIDPAGNMSRPIEVTIDLGR